MEYGADCPEYCSHLGKCAQERLAINEAEAYAEQAVERYYEGGWDTLGRYDTEQDREAEANDVGLQWMREQSGRA